jgi:hypothetical protein
MWAKLGNELLNLDHIVRVKFSKSWNKEGECLVAEVETLVNGEIKQVIRYRGAEAETLQAFFQAQTGDVGLPVKSAPNGATPTNHKPAIPAAVPAQAGDETRPPTATLREV